MTPEMACCCVGAPGKRWYPHFWRPRGIFVPTIPLFRWPRKTFVWWPQESKRDEHEKARPVRHGNALENGTAMRSGRGFHLGSTAAPTVAIELQHSGIPRSIDIYAIVNLRKNCINASRQQEHNAMRLFRTFGRASTGHPFAYLAASGRESGRRAQQLQQKIDSANPLYKSSTCPFHSTTSASPLLPDSGNLSVMPWPGGSSHTSSTYSVLAFSAAQHRWG